MLPGSRRQSEGNAWTDDEFVGACLLIASLSYGVPAMPTPSVPQMPERDPNLFEDSLVEFHMQAGLVDKTWILFDSGACANCCPDWFAPEYPVLPLNESAPSLRSLSGKTQDVQGRKIVQLDCGNGHSRSVQFYVCTGISECARAEADSPCASMAKRNA